MTSPFDKKFLENQRTELLRLKTIYRRELSMSLMDHVVVNQDEIIEEADWASVEQSRELSYNLHERKLKVLREIEAAIDRIDSGTYGICEDSGEPISIKRLLKHPWARQSIQYAQLAEEKAKKAA